MNYDQAMTQIINGQSGRPTLLLHSCCGPCSSAVLERLSPHFNITLLYYNPCIHPREEFEHRLAEQKRLIAEMPLPGAVNLVVPPYEPETFFAAVKGLEEEPEGGRRCRVCFEQRIGFTARMAAEQGFDYFATTLTVSPHKNAVVINEVGSSAALPPAVWLPSDFKKQNGYLRSLQLSQTYGLYRQNDCGCIFSKRKEVSL